MVSISYEEFIKKAKVAIGTSFEFKCPICGSPCIEPLAQINLSKRYPCENCQSIITVAKPHYSGESLEKLGELNNKIFEISINRPTHQEDKTYDGCAVRMKDGMPVVFGFTLKLR